MSAYSSTDINDIAEKVSTYGRISNVLGADLSRDVNTLNLAYRFIDLVEDTRGLENRDNSFNILKDVILHINNSNFLSYLDGLKFLSEEILDLIDKNDIQSFEVTKKYNIIFSSLFNLDSKIKNVFQKKSLEMIDGMSYFKNKIFAKNGEFIESFEEFDTYCNAVAGSVGVNLTSLFSFHSKNKSDYYMFLLQNNNGNRFNLAEQTGIFLQYANIISDREKDKVNGQTFWPSSDSTVYSQESLDNMINQSFKYLKGSFDYVKSLPKSSLNLKSVENRIRGFSALGILKYAYELINIRESDDVLMKDLSDYQKEVIKHEAIKISFSNYYTSKVEEKILWSLS